MKKILIGVLITVIVIPLVTLNRDWLIAMAGTPTEVKANKKNIEKIDVYINEQRTANELTARNFAVNEERWEHQRRGDLLKWQVLNKQSKND